MKITAFAVAALASLTSAEEFSLRATTARLGTQAQPSDPVQTSVIVKGLIDDASKEDIKIISESIVSAFNVAYADSGTSIDSFEPLFGGDDSVEPMPVLGGDSVDESMPVLESGRAWFWPHIPAPTTIIEPLPKPPAPRPAPAPKPPTVDHCGGWGCGGWDPKNPIHQQGYWYGIDESALHCRWCPDDDYVLGAEAEEYQYQSQSQAVLFLGLMKTKKSPLSVLEGPAVGSVHKKFEDSLCEMLRDSGTANLSNAKNCAFSFVETPGQGFGILPVEAAMTCKEGTPMSAQFAMDGTLDAFSEEDFLLIDKSIMDAYNEAFLSTGKAMVTFTADGNVGVAAMDNSKMLMGRFEPLCPNDDDVPPSTKLESMHEAFEQAFCAKLQNSGNANFAKVENCHFRLVVRPSDPGSSSMEAQKY